MGKKKRTMGFTAKQWRVAEQLGFTTEEMNRIDEDFELKGYPKAMEFVYGFNHYDKNEIDKAIASFIRGAKNEGCVGCSFFYAVLQQERGNIYLVMPFLFEAAIRGHIPSIGRLFFYYTDAKPRPALAFRNFWLKIMIESGDPNYTNERRLAYKKKDQSVCRLCGKEDSEDMNITLKKCGGCRYYFYCGQDCQRADWKNGEGGCNHMGECRQLEILRHYYRNNVEEIREAIIRGDNPKTIDRLQILRTRLGLSRPKEDYEDLVLQLSSDDKNDTSQSPNRFEYLTARKDGTVWIGSTPNVI